MASAVVPNDDCHINIDDKNLEIFSLIWLDADVNITEARNTEQKLRKIINHLKKFQDVHECQQYIEQSSEKDRLILIVSGQLGPAIVPHIDKLRQVLSIYVYCKNKKHNQKWSSGFTKVKEVVVDSARLISRIQTDHEIQKKVEEPLSISSSNTSGSAGKSTREVNGEFAFSQVLIDCLLRLKSTDIDKKELFNVCERMYQGNFDELDNLREFEKYEPNKVLRWYTRESFFYRTLNAALRRQDIHMVFLFRSFISDIHRALQHYQSKNPLKVYRGQKMSSDELKTLEQSRGQFISINSFFSTSINKESALKFLKTAKASDGLKRILFEIDADPNKATTKPFADVKEHSPFPKESEVLFMLGSIFRLDDIKPIDDDQLWVVTMTLYSDEEHDLKQVLVNMKKQYVIKETTLQTLGNFLWDMGEPGLAEKYFTRILDQLPPNDPLRINLYEDLTKLASQRKEHNISVQWREKLIAFKTQYPLAITPSVNKTNSTFAAAEDDSRQCYAHVSDIAGEPLKKQMPIRGWEKMPLVSLEEAVEPLVSIVSEVKDYADWTKEKCELELPADDLTADESASICLYTLEMESPEASLYFALNSTLRADDRPKLKPWFSYLKLFLTALSRLPSTCQTVYRRVNMNLSDQYPEGKKFVWWGFTSCTTSEGVITKEKSSSKPNPRTLFTIDCFSGKDISRHSYNSKEKEILIPAAREFEVVSYHEEQPGFYMIHVKEIRSRVPLLKLISSDSSSNKSPYDKETNQATNTNVPAVQPIIDTIQETHGSTTDEAANTNVPTVQPIIDTIQDTHDNTTDEEANTNVPAVQPGIDTNQDTHGETTDKATDMNKPIEYCEASGVMDVHSLADFNKIQACKHPKTELIVLFFYHPFDERSHRLESQIEFWCENDKYKHRVLFLKFDQENCNHDIFEEYNVEQVPTILYIKNNKQIVPSVIGHSAIKIAKNMDDILNGTI